jgi:serine/threonine protein kinase
MDSYFNKYRKYKQLYLNSKGGTVDPYSDFKAIQLGSNIEITNELELFFFNSKDIESFESKLSKPIKVRVEKPIGKPGAQGSAFVVVDKFNSEFVLKQILPVEYNEEENEYEGSCQTNSISFSDYTNSRKVVSNESIQPYFKRRDDYDDSIPLPRKVCDDMFMQELYYSVLFGNLGVSPNVIGYRLDNYCILMDKLDITLLEVWRKQGNKLKKCQWQQLLDIQKIINDTHIIHNDPKGNNYMVDDKGDIFIIDWGLATENKKWNEDYLDNRFPVGISQLNFLLPTKLSNKKGITWRDIATYFKLETEREPDTILSRCSETYTDTDTDTDTESETYSE